MWAQYEWLLWLVFGGLFLFLMFRGGGFCGGHGGHGDNNGKTPDGTTPRKQAHTGCH